jgi:hypothetical protein
MSRKLSVVLVGIFASVAFAAGFMQGCGGGSSSSNNVALCEKACDKALECTPDAGAVGQTALTQCKQNCQTQAGTTHCSNESAIASAVSSCLSMSCDSYITCVEGLPACQSTTGAGGTTGTGGSTGTGGTSGTADCSVCTKADACCTALAGGTPCNLVTTCNSVSGQSQQQAVSSCQAVLAAVAGNPQAPAACQ